jgi:SAM-dependent methyltransferase
MIEFTCNICGTANRRAASELGREVASCDRCGSSVRTRSLLYALSLELFGVSLALPDFPRVKSLRGIGMSDPSQYADGLAMKFDYRNTFSDREPRFDITHPAGEESGRYDFVISSEVLEHVPPPAEAAFANACRMLKETGVLLLTVPYSLERATREHYPELHEYGLAQVGDRVVLVNRARDGRLQVFDDLVFHFGWGEPSLEMREFTESGLRGVLAGAGFPEVRIYSEDYPPFGIVHAETWSLPVAARRGRFAFGIDATRDVVREWRDLKLKFNAEMDKLGGSMWFKIGRRLGLF